VLSDGGLHGSPGSRAGDTAGNLDDSPHRWSGLLILRNAGVTFAIAFSDHHRIPLNPIILSVLISFLCAIILFNFFEIISIIIITLGKSKINF